MAENEDKETGGQDGAGPDTGSNTGSNTSSNTSNQAQFALQRIYVKDLSFESPRPIKAFQEKWAPKVQMDINASPNQISEGIYEVVLTLTLTVTNNEETAYLVEIQQAGAFAVSGLPTADLERMLGAYCPNILFPYAREAVDNLVVRGGFPALQLAPVNFDAVFAEAIKRREAQQAGEQTH